MRLQPAGQVIGIIGVDAHARGIAVKGMPQLGGAVGLAPAQFGAGFHHRDAPGTRQAQQLHGQQGAAQATAHNQDISVADGRGYLCRVRFIHGGLSRTWVQDRPLILHPAPCCVQPRSD